jgi:membrane protein implicated in regulation of membrane protease activity
MVMGLIAGLFLLASSAVAFIIGILFLSESSEMTLSFISALILVTLAVLLIRKLFSTRKQNIKKTMDSMKISSNIKSFLT